MLIDLELKQNCEETKAMNTNDEPVLVPLLTIHNRHIIQSGDPPIVDDSEWQRYVGYFQNSFGEQWIFTREPGATKAILRGGDIGWQTEIEVVDGSARDLILDQAESLWLIACWQASSVGRQ